MLPFDILHLLQTNYCDFETSVALSSTCKALRIKYVKYLQGEYNKFIEKHPFIDIYDDAWIYEQQPIVNYKLLHKVAKFLDEINSSSVVDLEDEVQFRYFYYYKITNTTAILKLNDIQVRKLFTSTITHKTIDDKISFIMKQSNCRRRTMATRAFLDNNGDIDHAIMELEGVF